MRWSERIVVYTYLAFLTGWLLLLHRQGIIHHDALRFLFKYVMGIQEV